MAGVTKVKIENGDAPGTQKVVVTTDGSSELSHSDAVESLGSMAAKYVVKKWTLGEAVDEKPKALPEPMKSSFLAESQEWTNASGQTITAAVQKVDKGKVFFIMANGSTVPYEVSKLSPETISKLKELVAAQQNP